VTNHEEFILGVDLDGVCADYQAALRPVVAGRKGVPVDSLGPQNTWDFEEWGIVDRDDFLECHAEAVLRRRIFATMPMIEGCAETLWRLSNEGVWIRIITHRLQVKFGHSIAVSDTCTWLDAHDIPYRDICFLGQKPQVEADVYVDDAPHNVAALRAGGNDVIVFDQLYNRHLGGPRALSWPDVESYVFSKLS
jgi:5'-nucleotidase